MIDARAPKRQFELGHSLILMRHYGFAASANDVCCKREIKEQGAPPRSKKGLMHADHTPMKDLLVTCERRLVDMQQVLGELLDEVRRNRQGEDAGTALVEPGSEALVRMLKLLEPWGTEVPERSVPSFQLCRVDGKFQIGERKLPLRESEERVLAMLWESSPEAVSRDVIFAALYPQENKPGRGVIDVFLSGLRQKLKLASDGREYIVSVPRKGWTLHGERCQRN